MRYYRVDSVEGIGKSFARRLRQAGITSVNRLLTRTRNRRDRRRLATETRVTEALILKWANMADLYRVKGIGSEYAELLEKAGVDTIKELRKRKPQNLYRKILEVNTRGRRPSVRRVPGLKQVESWIRQAKYLTPWIRY